MMNWNYFHFLSLKRSSCNYIISHCSLMPYKIIFFTLVFRETLSGCTKNQNRFHFGFMVLIISSADIDTLKMFLFIRFYHKLNVMQRVCPEINTLHHISLKVEPSTKISRSLL